MKKIPIQAALFLLLCEPAFSALAGESTKGCELAFSPQEADLEEQGDWLLRRLREGNSLPLSPELQKEFWILWLIGDARIGKDIRSFLKITANWTPGDLDHHIPRSIWQDPRLQEVERQYLNLDSPAPNPLRERYLALVKGRFPKNWTYVEELFRLKDEVLRRASKRGPILYWTAEHMARNEIAPGMGSDEIERHDLLNPTQAIFPRIRRRAFQISAFYERESQGQKNLEQIQLGRADQVWLQERLSRMKNLRLGMYFNTVDLLREDLIRMAHGGSVRLSQYVHPFSRVEENFLYLNSLLYSIKMAGIQPAVEFFVFQMRQMMFTGIHSNFREENDFNSWTRGISLSRLLFDPEYVLDAVRSNTSLQARNLNVQRSLVSDRGELDAPLGVRYIRPSRGSLGGRVRLVNVDTSGDLSAFEKVNKPWGIRFFSQGQAHRVLGENLSHVSHRIPIPTPLDTKLSRLQVSVSESSLKWGLDYKVYYSSAEEGYFLELNSNIQSTQVSFDASFVPYQRRKGNVPVYLSRARVQFASEQLRAIGAETWGTALEEIALRESSPDEAVGNDTVLADSSVRALSVQSRYTYNSSFRETSASENPFQSFATYLDQRGRFCFQCDGAARILKRFFEESLDTSQGLTPRIRTVMSIDMGEEREVPVSLKNLHAELVLLEEGRVVADFDATPSEEDLGAEPQVQTDFENNEQVVRTIQAERRSLLQRAYAELVSARAGEMTETARQWKKQARIDVRLPHHLVLALAKSVLGDTSSHEEAFSLFLGRPLGEESEETLRGAVIERLRELKGRLAEDASYRSLFLKRLGGMEYAIRNLEKTLALVETLIPAIEGQFRELESGYSPIE